MTDPAFFRFTAPSRQPDDGAGSVLRTETCCGFYLFYFFDLFCLRRRFMTAPAVAAQLCFCLRFAGQTYVKTLTPCAVGSQVRGRRHVTCVPPPVAMGDQRSAEMSSQTVKKFSYSRRARSHTRAQCRGFWVIF